MAMTRKDYLAIAGVVKTIDDSVTHYPGNLFMQAAARRVVRRLIRELAREFVRANARFDWRKFEEACGFVYCSDEDNEHLANQNNLEDYARDTSKQKRRSNLAKVG